jgi:predicted DNA-binding protein with PD1-like motif
LLELGDNRGDLGDLVLQASAHGFRHLHLVLGVFKFGIDLVGGFLDLGEISTLEVLALSLKSRLFRAESGDCSSGNGSFLGAVFSLLGK